MQRELTKARDRILIRYRRDDAHGACGFDVQLAQGDLPAALTSCRVSLAIRERLAKTDPGNAGWQRDVALSCSKLGMHAILSTDERRGCLRRGLEIQQRLKASGRLPPNQHWTGWFDERLKELNGH